MMFIKTILTGFSFVFVASASFAQNWNPIQCPSGYARGEELKRHFYRVNWEGEEPVICKQKIIDGHLEDLVECEKNPKLNHFRNGDRSLYFETSDGGRIYFNGYYGYKDDNKYDHKSNRFLMEHEGKAVYKSEDYSKRLRVTLVIQQIIPCKKLTL